MRSESNLQMEKMKKNTTHFPQTKMSLHSTMKEHNTTPHHQA
jgi:hypothetical protein